MSLNNLVAREAHRTGARVVLVGGWHPEVGVPAYPFIRPTPIPGARELTEDEQKLKERKDLIENLIEGLVEDCVGMLHVV